MSFFFGEVFGVFIPFVRPVVPISDSVFVRIATFFSLLVVFSGLSEPILLSNFAIFVYANARFAICRISVISFSVGSTG